MRIDGDEHACYIHLTPAKIAKTVELSDAVMVDVDDVGEPVGLEFLAPAPEVTEAMLALVTASYPQLLGATDSDVRRGFLRARAEANR